eukprot:23873_1
MASDGSRGLLFCAPPMKSLVFSDECGSFPEPLNRSEVQEMLRRSSDIRPPESKRRKTNQPRTSRHTDSDACVRMAAQWSECLSQLPPSTTPNAHVSRAEPVTLTQENLAAHVEKVGDDPADSKSLSSKESVLSIQPKSPIKTRTCGISVCNYEGTVSSVLSRS